MTAPVINVFEFMLKLRNQLENVFSSFDGSKTHAAKLKAQVVITGEKLSTLSSDNRGQLLALALRPSTNISPSTHHAFCCAVVLSKLSLQQRYHHHFFIELVSAALTMRLGLDINKQDLSNTIYQRKRLTPVQKKHYALYPLHSANYLNKASLVSNNAIYATMQHQELLDGSGYPNKLSGHRISQSGQLLSLINKFVELVTPRHQRAPFSLTQSLSYLARRPHLYSSTLLAQLTRCVTTPAIGMATSLSAASFGVIESLDHLNGQVTVQRFDLIEGKYQQGSAPQELQCDSSVSLQVVPIEITDKKLYQLISEQELVTIADNSVSISRLKPASSLTDLLEALAVRSPEHEVIAQQISALPVLGDKLISALYRQYPGRQFNNSFHALQMVGFTQSRPLLSLLALRGQLNHFQFPALTTLEYKIDTLLSVIKQIGEFTREALPNQLMMFALLNLAPLYLDKRVHQTNLPAKIDIDKVQVLQGASLFGLNASPKQFQIINTLARLWEGDKSIRQILVLENDLSKTKDRLAHELVQSYQLALLITHQCFHGLELAHQGVEAQVASISRRLKISAKELDNLSHLTLETGAYCPLG